MLAAAMSTLSSLFHTMGTAAGRDLYEQAMQKKGNSLFITRTGVLVVILISTSLAWMSVGLPVADGIIAKFTTMFFELTAAAFLPIYVGALYFKRMPKAAAKGGMVAGTLAWFIWTFFIHANAGIMQICNLLTGKPYLVKGTAFEGLSMIGTNFIALPISIIVTLILWGGYAYIKKVDLGEEHIERCFTGM